MKILCASSEREFVASYCDLITFAGYRLICSTTESEVLSELDSGTIGLVMTDMLLENGSGHSSVELAKQHQIPVVVISHNAAKLFHQPYADLYLEPPIAPQELLAIIKALLICRAPAEEPMVHAAALR